MRLTPQEKDKLLIVTAAWLAEMFADGELLTCEPAEVMPMAQRYSLL